MILSQYSKTTFKEKHRRQIREMKSLSYKFGFLNVLIILLGRSVIPVNWANHKVQPLVLKI